MKSQHPTDGGAPTAELRVNSVEDDRWTWVYLEPDSGVELWCNTTYASRQEAAESALKAYPDLSLAEEEEDSAGE